MKTTLKTVVGTVLAVAGVAVFAWLWLAAQPVGSGMRLGVQIAGLVIPYMVPVIAGFGLLTFGLAIGYGHLKPVGEKG